MGITAMRFDVHEEREHIEHPVIRRFLFGSHIYGTANIESDKDYIVVIDAPEGTMYNCQNFEGSDYVCYSYEDFRQAIFAHKVQMLEVLFYHEFIIDFKLDLQLLRKEFSSVASNSYVKCKKKIADGEVYIGLKSLYHSLRILMYGIQIAKHGKIVDFYEANCYYEEIMDIGGDWDKLHKRFKPIYNKLKSELRTLAPLEG